MLDTLLAKVVGTQNDRELKRLRPIVTEVNAFEPAIKGLSDEQLRGKTKRDLQLLLITYPEAYQVLGDDITAAYLNGAGPGVSWIRANDDAVLKTLREVGEPVARGKELVKGEGIEGSVWARDYAGTRAADTRTA